MNARALRPTAADVYLPPGVLWAGEAPATVRTVLGSCVSVCLWARRPRVGGMNHYLLPRGPSDPETASRYGESALALLLAQVTALGARPDQLEARIYGGATVLTGMASTAHLGASNVDLARQWAAAAGIPVVDEDVLGQVARRIAFDIERGSAEVSRLGEKR